MLKNRYIATDPDRRISTMHPIYRLKKKLVQKLVKFEKATIIA
jgi:hypothetical protein